MHERAHDHREIFFGFEVFMAAETTQAIHAMPLPNQRFANCVGLAHLPRAVF
jgi:hypothetical protein